jgi:hypothetical protein
MALCITNMAFSIYSTFSFIRERKEPTWYIVWKLLFGPVYTITSFLLACVCLAKGDYVGTGIFSAWALMGGWSWWHDDDTRRRRKRLRKKMAAKVTDVGGKLKVLIPGGASA